MQCYPLPVADMMVHQYGRHMGQDISRSHIQDRAFSWISIPDLGMFAGEIWTEESGESLLPKRSMGMGRNTLPHPFWDA